jgi:N-acetylmuramoyl-L-alanine amidase
MKKVIVLTTLFAQLSLLFFPMVNVFAQTFEQVQIDKVEQKGSYYDLGIRIGVSKIELEKVSPRVVVEIEERLIVPEIIAGYDMVMKLGVSELDLEKVSPQPLVKIEEKAITSETSVKTGEKSFTPETITIEEKELLARLVTAEAKGEPYEGKVEVAAVVLNRVEHEQYPDTIKEVIYEKRQFQPVENGTINKPAIKEAKEAVNEAIELEVEEEGTDSLNFYNPQIVESEWHQSKTVTARIGNHVFTK